MFKFNKRRVKAVAGVVVALLVAIAAVAYWTAGGSGSGDGTVASNPSDVALTATGLDGLAPGVSKSYGVSYDNPNGYSVRVTAVSVDDAYGAGASGGSGGNGITIDSTHANAGCDAGWYSANASGGSVNKDVPANHGAASSSNVGSVTMSNLSGVNQNACQGATVTLHLKAN